MMINILNNLFTVLKKFRLAAIFNIFGLSTAFAAFVVLMIQLNFEYNFDKCHSNSDRIYRINLNVGDKSQMIIPRPFMEEFKEFSPHVEAGTVIFPYVGSIYFSAEAGRDKKYRETFEMCTPDITDVFTFDIIEGSKDCLKNPDNLLIPQSMARLIFGETSAVGKKIHLEKAVWSKNTQDFIVGGVYRDFPGNTQLNNSAYMPMDDDFMKTEWGPNNFLVYLLLDNSQSAAGLADSFNKYFDFTKLGRDHEDRKEIQLIALGGIYYMNEAQDGNIVKSGNKETSKLLLGIAVLIILIAAINYINFSSSLAPRRIKSINIQKVLGSSDFSLRVRLISEAVFITVLSFLLSLVYLFVLEYTDFFSFLDVPVSLARNIDILFFSAFVAVLIGILSGLYPAFYMTSFSPAFVLKGDFGFSSSGRKLRIVLIGFQFVISIALIIGASFIWLQNNYMQGYSLGFDKDQIAVVELDQHILEGKVESYVNQLKSFAGIEDVAFSALKLGTQDNYPNTGYRYKDETFMFYTIPVSWNFFDVMGIEVLEGTSPTPGDFANEKGMIPYYFNVDMRDKYRMKVGDILEFHNRNSHIAGFVDNVKFTSLRKGIDNESFIIVLPEAVLPVAYICLKPGIDYFAAFDHIQKTTADLDSSNSFKIEFYDSLFGQLYHKEKNLQKMVTIFCLLAIIISIVGVFGLVIFETEYRRKEIGIRKVFGADIKDILSMFNKKYILIIIICFIIAVPVTYYLISEWLQNFAYKTPVYWWLFALSGLVIFVITLLVVNFQSWRAAINNPVDSIKNE